MHGGCDVEPYVCHVFPMKNVINSEEQARPAVTYLQHYQMRMLSTDPLEGRDAAMKAATEAQILISMNGSNGQSYCLNLACKLMAVEGYESRKTVVESLTLDAYDALHNWCCMNMIIKNTCGVCCRLCGQRNNSKLRPSSIALSESLKESQVICHFIGRQRVAAVFKICGDNSLRALFCQ